MSGRSAGHAIVAQLEAEGVRHLFCVPGESFLDLLDGLHDSRIATVVARQEGGAGFMAVADARLRRDVGVAAVTRGPGAANAMIAVHTAYQDSTPLLLLVGLIPVADRHRESFQEFDLAGWFGITAKAVVTLDEPGRAAELIRDAAHLARSGRPGPVVVGLPEDVLVGPSPDGPLPSRAVATGAVSPSQVAAVAEAIAGARRPVVVLGGDQLTGAGAADLRRWVEAWRLPVLTDFRAQDLLENDSPSFCGWLGYGRSPVSAELLDEADVVVFVGEGARDLLSDGRALGRPDRRVVVVGTDPAAVGHHGGIDVHLLVSPDVWAAAAAHTGGAAPAAPVWAGRTEAARAAYVRHATPRPDEPAVGVDLGVVMERMRSHLRPDAVITYGAGNHCMWAQRYLPHHRTPSLLSSRNGAMGFGVPAAVAAAITQPGRQVVSVAGDGCFLMNGQELATAAAVGARLTVVVVDNAQYGTIRAHQETHYPGRVSGTALVNPDFGAFARSFGAFGARAETTAEAVAAVDAAFASEGPAVLHLVVDPRVLLPRVGGEARRDGG